ncbi:RNA polymerase sigma factor rpoD [Ralstonia solanacearum UW551]|uniref:RNA polymerase sigma factor rpoD n=1 Tax=Ralstonia solanacearum (strain UW551) TaxID=342110 RepID=A0AB33VGK6_RALSU|nr:RNA polymerase sigma factor rpoD [Ralstonia solanacearum UW551]
MVKVKTSAKAGSKASPVSDSASRTASARGAGGGKTAAGTAKLADGRSHMGQAGGKAAVPAKTGKAQPRKTAEISVAAKPAPRAKGAIQSSTSGKVSTSMSTSARPGGTAASVALKGKTTTVAKSKSTEVESKESAASARAAKTGTARTSTAKPTKAADADSKRTVREAEAIPTPTSPAPRAAAAAEPKKRGRKPRTETQADDESSTDVTEEFDEAPAAPAPKSDKQKARDRKAKEKALLKEFAATQQGGSEEELEARRQKLKALIKLGKSRGYLTYAEINDHLPDDMVDAESMDTLVATLNDIGIAVYEQAPDAETLLLNDNAPSVTTEEEAEEEAEAALSTVDSEFGRTTDPVRMYMREMGTVELLTREGEIEIAKRIEAGLKDMVMAISACPVTISEILAMGERVANDEAKIDEYIDGLIDLNAEAEAQSADEDEDFEDEEADEGDDEEEDEDDDGAGGAAASARQLEELKQAALESSASWATVWRRCAVLLKRKATSPSRT